MNRIQNNFITLFCLLAVFVMWSRQLLSFTYGVAGFNNITIHKIEAVFIGLSILFFYKNIINLFLKVKEFHNLFYLFIVYICYLGISNSIASHTLNEFASKAMLEWYVQMLVLFSLVGILNHIFKHHQEQTFINKIGIFFLVLVLISSTFYIRMVSGDTNLSKESTAMLQSANRMIYGKAFFVCLFISLYRLLNIDKKKRTIDLTLHIIVIITVIILSVFVSVRTAITAFVILFIMHSFNSWKTYIKLFKNIFIVLFVIGIFTILIIEETNPDKKLIQHTIQNFSKLNFISQSMDEFTSGRYYSNLLGFEMFLSEMTHNTKLFFIGYGSIIGPKKFYSYYANNIGRFSPDDDLRNYLTGGTSYSPHNVFADSLVCNGIIGFGLILTILVFMIKTMVKFKRKTKIVTIRKRQNFFLLVSFTVILVFFASDLDFSGNRISMITVLIMFLFIVFLYRKSRVLIKQQNGYF